MEVIVPIGHGVGRNLKLSWTAVQAILAGGRQSPHLSLSWEILWICILSLPVWALQLWFVCTNAYVGIWDTLMVNGEEQALWGAISLLYFRHLL